MSLSLYLYAYLASSVWQMAKAAPAIACHSLPASGGVPLRIAGHQPSFNTLRDIDYPNSLYRAPIDASLTCVQDTQDNEAKTFGWLVTGLLGQSKDSPAQPLGLDTMDKWETFVKHYQEITGGQIGSLKDWLQKSNVVQGSKYEEEVSDLEWLFHRASSQQGVWWKSNQLADWREAKYDWKSMITVGDQLQFDQTETNFELSKKRIKHIQKDLIKLLESGKWTIYLLDSLFGGANGAEASVEFQVLRANGGKHFLYDERIGQVYNKIFNKMALFTKRNRYQEEQAKLPDDLTSDLYLLALLRGKAEKTMSGTQYVVATPAHTVTVLKSLDGQELSASFYSKSQGRLLTGAYEQERKRKLKTRVIIHNCNQGSHLVNPWAIPVNAWRSLVDKFKEKVLRRDNILSN